MDKFPNKTKQLKGQKLLNTQGIKAMSKRQQKQKVAQSNSKYFKYLNYQIQNIKKHV